jgi:hypothetical protein
MGVFHPESGRHFENNEAVEKYLQEKKGGSKSKDKDENKKKKKLGIVEDK